MGYYGAQAHASLEAACRAAIGMSCTSAAVVVRDFATGRRFSQAEVHDELLLLKHASQFGEPPPGYDREKLLRTLRIWPSMQLTH